MGGALPSGTLIFTPQQTSQVVTLALAGTNLVDFDLAFTVTLDQAPVVAQTLTYTVQALTGASAATFAGGTLPTGTVTFAAGQTMATITAVTQNSTAIQADAAFNVVLSNPSPKTTIATASAEGASRRSAAICRSRRSGWVIGCPLRPALSGR